LDEQRFHTPPRKRSGFDSHHRDQMSKVNVLVESDFDEIVLGSDQPVMVDFSADWCRPCKALEPIMDSLAEDIPHKVFKMDIDDCVTLTNKYKIMSVPTVIVFKNGQIHKRFVGVTNKEALLKLFE